MNKVTFSISMCLIFIGCATLDGVRSNNRENLSKLKTGFSKDEVLGVMGQGSTQTWQPGILLLPWPATKITNPYRTEVFPLRSDTLEVLYYYTDIKAADGAITDDELTPIVLKNGKLDGWGWMYWNDTVKRYEIRLR